MPTSKSKAARERNQRRRLADPVTYAAADAALAAGEARFRMQMDAVLKELQALPRDLTGVDAVKSMALRAEYDALAIKQKQFIEVDFARRLDPDGGAEDVPVAPRHPTSPNHA